MAWIDDLKNPFTIQTGDGATYTPLWVPTSRIIPFNVAEFDFIDVVGSLVSRRMPKARRFPVDFIFQGANHLADAAAFEQSAYDPRPWTVTHPYYGRLLVQPTELEVNNKDYNISRFTGTLVETISDQYPKGSPLPQSAVSGNAVTTNTALAAAFGNNANPVPATVTAAASANQISYTNYIKLVPADAAAGFINNFKRAEAANRNLLTAPLEAIEQLQQVIYAPALWAVDVPTRMAAMQQQLLNYRSYLAGTTLRANKYLYQAIAGTTLSAMAATAASPQATDYQTRTQVLDTADQLYREWYLYMVDMDTLQTSTGSSPDSFVPDADAIGNLQQLVYFTISNLFTIAQGAKQLRSFYLENDSNWITLAHRLYGLPPDDSTITQLIDLNGAGISEMLLVRKGRKISYYVG